ncbi:hypothetical protein D9M71_503690 [compost metagenome]
MEYSRQPIGTSASTSACGCKPIRWSRRVGSWRPASAWARVSLRPFTCTWLLASSAMPLRNASIRGCPFSGSISTRSPASQLAGSAACRPSRYTGWPWLPGLSSLRRTSDQLAKVGGCQAATGWTPVSCASSCCHCCRAAWSALSTSTGLNALLAPRSPSHAWRRRAKPQKCGY